MARGIGMKRVLFVLLGCVFLMTPIYAQAAEYNIVYKDGQFQVKEDDTLGEDIVLMPGDHIVQNITVSNHSKEAVKMYLEISTSTQLSDDMKEWIEISISGKQNGWLPMFQSEELNAGFLNEKIEIGTFEPGQVNLLTVDLFLSQEADNRSQDIDTELEYIFVAEKVKKAPPTGDKGSVLYIGGVLFCVALLAWFANKKTQTD